MDSGQRSPDGCMDEQRLNNLYASLSVSSIVYELNYYLFPV